MCHFDAVIWNCLAAQMTQAQLWNISTWPKQQHATFISLIALKRVPKTSKCSFYIWKIILTAVCNPFGFGTFRVNCYEWLNTRFIMNMPMFASMRIKIISKVSGWCQKPMAGVDVQEKRGNKATLYQETCWNHAWSRTVSRLLSGSALAWPLVVMNRKVHSAEFR